MFKVHQRLVICLGVLIMSCSSFAQTKLIQNLGSGKSQKVLCLGTSNYVNATPGAGGTWIPQVEQVLNSTYSGTATFYAAGQSGQNSSRGVQVIDGLMDQYNPDTVIMGFAINDGTGSFDETARRLNIKYMVHAVRTHNPDAEIIFFNIVSPEDVPGFASRTLRPNHAAALNLWDSIAQEEGLLHVNLYSQWDQLRVNDPSTYLSYTTEGVHMTPAGNAAITTPAFIDAISVPEPGTIAMLGVAGCMIARRRRNRG